MEKRKISVAIPEYNNSKFAKDVLLPILSDKRIDEIIIVDDNSEDYEKTLSVVREIDAKNKVKMYRNLKRCGALKNKLEAVERCKNKWLVLLDSDNTIDKNYIDKIFEIKPWKDDTIYCPDFAKPNFDFREWSGFTFDACNIKQYLKLPAFDYFLNDGNYFLNKKKYLTVVSDNKNSKVVGVDVMFLNVLWLLAGNKLRIVKGMDYLHRVHANSTILKSDKEKLEVCHRRIIDALVNNKPAPKFHGFGFFLELIIKKTDRLLGKYAAILIYFLKKYLNIQAL